MQFRIRILDAYCECDSTASRELRRNHSLSWRARFHKIVQNPVGYCFIEGVLIPIRSKVKLERLTLHAETVRHVINIYPGKIGLPCHGTNGSEIVRFKMDPIIPARRGIPEGLKARLCGRSGNSHFASSEKCQLACAFRFCHGGVKGRPKAIKVNRPWFVGMRAIRQPGLDTLRSPISLSACRLSFVSLEHRVASSERPTPKGFGKPSRHSNHLNEQ